MWVIHLSLGSTSQPDILDIVLNFFRGPYILTWINFAAKRNDLEALTVASCYLTDIVVKLRTDDNEFLVHHQAVRTMECWAIDLVKIVGKFGHDLIQNPDSIYKQIPTLCPESSIIYHQFGRKEKSSLHVSQIANHTWDGFPVRLSLDHGATASAIVVSKDHIAILVDIQDSTDVVIYSAIKFEEQRRIKHPEQVSTIQINKVGSLVITYGHLTTRVWDVVTGSCVRKVENLVKVPKPHTLLFVNDDNTILAGSEDGCIRYFSLEKNSTKWITKTEIKDESLEGNGGQAPYLLCCQSWWKHDRVWLSRASRHGLEIGPTSAY